MLRASLFLLVATLSCAFGSVIPSPESDDPFGGRIVGGNQIPITDAPWQVSLQYYSNHICGGSVLSATAVVTGARCFDYGVTTSWYSVRAGSAIWSSGGVLSSVSDIDLHPSYNPTTADYDVAVVTVSGLSGGAILPINLPASGSNVDTGYPLFTSGWGYLDEADTTHPTDLYGVFVNKVDWNTCDTAYGGLLTNQMICAAASGRDACIGDSGGPLANGNVLVGIVSWGFGCADPLYPGVYANVAKSDIRSFIVLKAGL